jgi:hypothetical protein
MTKSITVDECAEWKAMAGSSQHSERKVSQVDSIS